MPRLLLLRHAKAERALPGENDHERALAKRGRHDAQAMAETLADRGDRPDLVLCSTSVRTRQTWDAVRAALAELPEERFLRDIYEAGTDYLTILRREGEAAQAVLLVGHNPAIHATAVRLAEDLAGRQGATLSPRFPTGAVAIFEFEGAWAEILPASMRLAAFLAPPGGGD